jgi:hypothetical protein
LIDNYGFPVAYDSGIGIHAKVSFQKKRKTKKVLNLEKGDKFEAIAFVKKLLSATVNRLLNFIKRKKY